MTTVVVAGLVVVAVLAGALVLRPRGRHGVANQVEAFEAARQVTNRWSSDPSSTPRPLQEYLADQRRRAQERDEPPPER